MAQGKLWLSFWTHSWSKTKKENRTHLKFSSQINTLFCQLLTCTQIHSLTHSVSYCKVNQCCIGCKPTYLAWACGTYVRNVRNRFFNQIWFEIWTINVHLFWNSCIQAPTILNWPINKYFITYISLGENCLLHSSECHFGTKNACA